MKCTSLLLEAAWQALERGIVEIGYREGSAREVG